MGKDAGDSFEPTPNVMNAYDKRFFQPGVLEPKAQDDILVVGTLGTPTRPHIGGTSIRRRLRRPTRAVVSKSSKADLPRGESS